MQKEKYLPLDFGYALGDLRPFATVSHLKVIGGLVSMDRERAGVNGIGSS